MKNQIDGVEEDRLGKPNRPVASGRISIENATLLYYALFLSMWVASYYTNNLLCTFIYSVAIVVYNEGALARIPVVKNFIGALGLAFYCWGTTVILGMFHSFFPLAEPPVLLWDDAYYLICKDRAQPLHGLKAIAVWQIGALFATTVSAASYADTWSDY